MSRPRRLPKVLSASETASVLDQFNTRYPTPLRNLCLVRVMLEAGLRVGEVVALRPEHLDMTTCKLVVREGKGAKDRVLWGPDGLRDLIGAWLDRRPESFVATFRRRDMLWDEDSRRNLLVWYLAERTAHEITDEAHR